MPILALQLPRIRCLAQQLGHALDIVLMSRGALRMCQSNTSIHAKRLNEVISFGEREGGKT